ncbi:MAG: hypothetical protein NT170_00795 [Candidatus Moranbacteria bacterium]|nr:hypothetical protein [Candidatus Moranbacteria bacterium]
MDIEKFKVKSEKFKILEAILKQGRSPALYVEIFLPLADGIAMALYA